MITTIILTEQRTSSILYNNQRTVSARDETQSAHRRTETRTTFSKHHLIQHSMAVSLNAGPKGPAPSMEFVFVLEHSENAWWLQDREVSHWAHGNGFGTHHEGSIAARPQALAPAVKVTRGTQRIRTMPSTNSDLHTLLGYPSSPRCEGIDCSPMLRASCRK